MTSSYNVRPCLQRAFTACRQLLAGPCRAIVPQFPLRIFRHFIPLQSEESDVYYSIAHFQ